MKKIISNFRKETYGFFLDLNDGAGRIAVNPLDGSILLDEGAGPGGFDGAAISPRVFEGFDLEPVKGEKDQVRLFLRFDGDRHDLGVGDASTVAAWKAATEPVILRARKKSAKVVSPSRLAGASLPAGEFSRAKQALPELPVMIGFAAGKDVPADGAQIATIVAWDIRSSSRWHHSFLDHPAETASFYRGIFALVSQVAHENQGYIDKFSGDSVVAIFGISDGGRDTAKTAALNALRAARTVKNRFCDLLKGKFPRWFQPFTDPRPGLDLICSIHTGPILLGDIGLDGRHLFTALGPHVRFAEHLDSWADVTRHTHFPLVVSASTFSHLRGEPEIGKVEMRKLSSKLDYPVEAVFFVSL
jgi:class 3 adenylate cyclase